MKFESSALMKTIVGLFKIAIFSVVLCTVIFYTFGLYKKNIPEILNGTWEYDKLEAAFMGAPLIMVFLFLLYVGVKIYDGRNTKNINKNT